jgi:hypothetical protein
LSNVSNISIQAGASISGAITRCLAFGSREATRPSFPILYHGGYRGIGGDTSDTIARIRAANACFAAACR